MLKLCSTLSGSTCLSGSQWIKGTDKPFEITIEGDGLIGSQLTIGFKYNKADSDYVLNLTTISGQIVYTLQTNKKLVANFTLSQAMSLLLLHKKIPYPIEYSIFLDAYDSSRYLLDNGTIQFVSLI